jgi:hypothetical protein
MYRTCCITTGDSPTSLSVTTLFDTDANPTSFVNRQVAAWIESQQSPRAYGKRKHSPAPLAAVSLAGTSQSSPIYGSVVFNLTFFNEVTRSNETLYRLHASVIDSCIDIIVGRPVIREHHLIQKIPHYCTQTSHDHLLQLLLMFISYCVGTINKAPTSIAGIMSALRYQFNMRCVTSDVTAAFDHCLILAAKAGVARRPYEPKVRLPCTYAMIQHIVQQNTQDGFNMDNLMLAVGVSSLPPH